MATISCISQLDSELYPVIKPRAERRGTRFDPVSMAPPEVEGAPELHARHQALLRCPAYRDREPAAVAAAEELERRLFPVVAALPNQGEAARAALPDRGEAAQSALPDREEAARAGARATESMTLPDVTAINVGGTWRAPDGSVRRTLTIQAGRTRYQIKLIAETREQLMLPGEAECRALRQRVDALERELAETGEALV